MANVSRPLIALLIATVVVFAVWFVALRPSSSSSGGSASAGAYHHAIDAAHGAVATSAAASAAAGGTVPRTTQTNPASPPAAPSAPAATAPRSVSIPGSLAKASHHAAAARVPRKLTAAQRANLVTRALVADKVLALLFYNPAAADDRAVKAELAAVPTHGQKVVKLAVPLSELEHYSALTTHVSVNQAPTLVLIDRSHTASMIVGFADRFEIAQRVSDALAGR